MRRALSTRTLRTEIWVAPWFGAAKRCSPRLSPGVQSAPHLPIPAGRRGRIERVERRDYPACFSQPYQGQGHHVIMCEWIRRGSPGISVLISTFTLQYQPALIFLFWDLTGHFSHETWNLHRIDLLRVQAPSEVYAVPGVATSIKYPRQTSEGQCLLLPFFFSGNDGLIWAQDRTHSSSIFNWALIKCKVIC